MQMEAAESSASQRVHVADVLSLFPSPTRPVCSGHWITLRTQELISRPIVFLPLLEVAVKEMLLEEEPGFFEKLNEVGVCARCAIGAM